MHFYAIEKPEKLIESAFTHARKLGPMKSERMSSVQNRKQKVTRKMEGFYDYLDKQLERAEKSVPQFDTHHPFYQELLPETLNVGKMKQAASHIVSVRKLLKRQIVEGKRSMHTPATDAIDHMHKASARYFGRSASIVKSLKQSIEMIHHASQLVKEVPDVKTDVPTLILAGFPNTGKTTLLSRLTGSKAKIASYPFTTKSLQLGYFTMRYREVQVIDTPGLLDRTDELRNPIEKKAMAALKHLATCIVFVVAPTPAAGFTLDEQKLLLSRLQKQFSTPFVLVINKCDLATKEQIETAQKEFGMDAVRDGVGMESGLKDHVWRALGFSRGKEHSEEKPHI